MPSEEKKIIMRVVEHYVRTGEASDSEVKVVRLPDSKTSYVEQYDGGSRGLSLNQYDVEGRVIWATFSNRTGTVYISDSRRP